MASSYTNIAPNRPDRARNIITESDEFIQALRYRLKRGLGKRNVGIYRPGKANF